VRLVEVKKTQAVELMEFSNRKLNSASKMMPTLRPNNLKLNKSYIELIHKLDLKF